MPAQPDPTRRRILVDPALSCHREQLLQHELVAALLKDAWFRRDQEVEILWPEVDFAGYDLVLSCNGVTRQVQLKSSNVGGAAARQKLNLSLARAPSGCVVWTVILGWASGDPPVIEVKYRVVGGPPGRPIDSLADFPAAKHTKGNAQGIKLERPNIRAVPSAAFSTLSRISEVSDWLFGPPSPPA